MTMASNLIDMMERSRAHLAGHGVQLAVIRVPSTLMETLSPADRQVFDRHWKGCGVTVEVSKPI